MTGSSQPAAGTGTDANAIYALGSSEGETARLQRQADELAPDSHALLDRTGLRPGQSAIDLGCGPRGILDLLAERVSPGGTVVGLDADPAHAATAARLATQRGLDGVQILTADARRTGLPSGSFDLVHTRTLLITIPEPAEVVAEMARLARPGGQVAAMASMADEVRGRPGARAVRLVAVDGRGGAGKSTLARALAAACGGAPVVRVDDFLYWGDIDGWWPRLEREALRPLLDGSPARFRTRDWAGDPLGQGLGRWAEILPAEVVIVEGITSSRQAIAADLAMALWVETPRAERLRRAIARDGEERRPLWREWMVLEDEFFTRDRAAERADYVVSGQPRHPCDPVTEAVVLRAGRGARAGG